MAMASHSFLASSLGVAHTAQVERLGSAVTGAGAVHGGVNNNNENDRDWCESFSSSSANNGNDILPPDTTQSQPRSANIKYLARQTQTRTPSPLLSSYSAVAASSTSSSKLHHRVGPGGIKKNSSFHLGRSSYSAEINANNIKNNSGSDTKNSTRPTPNSSSSASVVYSSSARKSPSLPSSTVTSSKSMSKRQSFSPSPPLTYSSSVHHNTLGAAGTREAVHAEQDPNVDLDMGLNLDEEIASVSARIRQRLHTQQQSC